MRVGFVSEPAWREGIARERGRGAELICLPHLSFAPYIAAVRNRAGLELAERPPSRSLRDALEVADGAWLAASAYESEGEGVFYVTSYLAGPGGALSSYRQKRLEASAGRYEQMFWSPGHGPRETVALPLGRAATLVGADLRDPGSWAEVAAAGARVVVGGASEPADLWERTLRVVAGMAAAHGMTALVVNRADARDGIRYPGGSAAFDREGSRLDPDDAGIHEIGSA
jgi:predicted amidohydrolase